MKSTLIFFGTLFFISVEPTQLDDKPVQIKYDFKMPIEEHFLPEILHEISGLTDIDDHRIACIQDELGLIFLYDLNKKEIIERYQFAAAGDYEGITYTGHSVFILRSDGMLIECSLSDDHNNVTKVDSFYTDIPAKDNEGLCFDRQNNRLLIGSKSKIGNGSEFKDVRGVYAYDLTTKVTSKEPVINIYRTQILDFADKNNIKLPSKTKKKSGEEIADIKIAISALAVHPESGEYYILSARDYLLIICNKKGEIQNLVLLDQEKFQKAEGITFFDNGDLLISNEGVDQQPTLFKFGMLD